VAQDRREVTDPLRRIVDRWAQPADEWRTKVQHWVDAGVVSPVQGTEIVALESIEPAKMWRARVKRPTLSPVVELLSYVGIIVVGLGTALFLGHYWSAITISGRLIVALTITVAGLGAGFVVAQIGDAAARRLSGFVRLLATAGVASATAIAVGPSGEHHRGLTLFCVGVVTLGLSASLWRNRDRSLQFLTTLLGVALTIGGVGVVARLHPTSSEVALFVWFFSVAVGLMSLQMLRPAPTALTVAVLGGFVGAFALSFPNHLGGVLLGLLSALSAVGIGFALERPSTIVIGAVGFFMFDFRIFTIYLRSTSAALGAFILGLVLVLVALVHALRSSIAERREASALVEVQFDSERYERS
jgi:predicted membrane protein DUF2157